ncbi:hypothetical protein CLCR_00308 [Cladophialophora carrionii]|uniref:Uncharacterized protein n=1 Tax=Cladophialophora carrionii TaxID=86049 RepID=A0A1C1D0D9_9EURO|nr:hypothetical protein CLCR_00308 [Cladophialophora carrionii]
MKSLYCLVPLGMSATAHGAEHDDVSYSPPINHITITSFPMPSPDPAMIRSITAVQPLLANMTVTALEGFQSPIPTLLKQGGLCQGGMAFCDGLWNCCPGGTYCTVDSQGAGACCANGAACTGLSTPIPAQAWSNTGVESTPRPRRIFGFLARLARSSSWYTADNSAAADLAATYEPDAPKVEGKNEGGGGGKGHGEVAVADPAPKLNLTSAKATFAQNAMSWGAPMPRPSSLPDVSVAPVGFARQIRPAIVPSKTPTSRSAPKLKFIGANPATIKSQQNQTSSGAGVSRPLSVFKFPVIFANNIKAAFLPPSEAAETRVQNCLPCQC